MSDDHKPVNPQDLQQAFSLFNLASEQLSGAYQELQQQVEQLTRELAVANGELRRQFLEKQALSQRLSLLLAALPAGVVVLDQESRVIEANPASHAMLGEPLLGEAWHEVTTRRLRQTSALHEWELQTADTARPARRISISSSPLDAGGGCILLLHDVSEAYAMQRELQRHQRLSAMGEMAARLAHQLRTPLATALLYGSHLARPILAENDRVRFAEKTVARLRHLEHLIQDLLLFVKGETGGQEVVLIGGLLAELQQVMEPQMAQRGLRFDVDADAAGEAGIMGSREALTGALLSLLENAIQACAEGDSISLSAQTQGNDVILTVADTGRGIDTSLQGRLFEPFFTTRTEGTGLGLAIVRSVVQAHGGEVVVDSAPGAGSRFVIRLPGVKL